MGLVQQSQTTSARMKRALPAPSPVAATTAHVWRIPVPPADKRSTRVARNRLTAMLWLLKYSRLRQQRRIHPHGASQPSPAARVRLY